MKKTIWFAFSAIVIYAAIAISCDDSISYAERKKTERQRISSLINRLGLTVHEGLPADSVFDPNVYYKDPETDIYINVLDYGDKTKMAKIPSAGASGSDVYYRFQYAHTLSTYDTLYYSSTQPLKLVYGVMSTYTSTSTDFEAYFLSSACVLPLKYVGDNALVNLIVPFNYGSYAQRSTYETYFLEKIRYTIK